MSEERSTVSHAMTAEEVLDVRARSLALEVAADENSDRVALLLFRIGEEWYAVRVSDVREIFQTYDVTPIPCVPGYVLGVTNVRGEIISVTDPALLSSLGSAIGTDDVRPPAIVITKDGVTTALVVDEIGDIEDVPSDAFEPPVSIIGRAQAEFIAGSACVDEEMVGLLNVDRILAPLGALKGQ